MSADVLRVKLRINNNIYSVKISPSCVTDILMKGMESTTVKAIMRGRPESVVTGQFANAVEILSAVNLADINQGKELQNNEQIMEVEITAAAPVEEDTQQFESHVELLKYVYNSCVASGRIKDAIELVKSQQRVHAFDYPFAFTEGEVLFKLHGDELQNEIQLLLYDLVRSHVPQWKQMRVLEVVSAIVAETLIEMGVIILSEPVEIHWPNGYITKPIAPNRGKGGKKQQKSKHGIFGEFVAKLAPSLPVASEQVRGNKSKVAPKVFKTPVKSKKSKVAEGQNTEAMEVEPKQVDSNVHQGLPVQARRAWSTDEMCDVLLLFKAIQLDANLKNNYKELSRRMADAGWCRDNNSCRQQIDRLKKRYDAMTAASKKTGSVLYFEPLRLELNDCFGALKDVTPEMVFSNRQGLNENLGDAEKGDNGDLPQAERSTSGDNTNDDANGSGGAKKKKTKSRQPVVSLMEGVLEKVVDKWNDRDDQMQGNIETLIQLQRDRLHMEQQRLQFEREMAGLKTNNKKSQKIGKGKDNEKKCKTDAHISSDSSQEN